MPQDGRGLVYDRTISKNIFQGFGYRWKCSSGKHELSSWRCYYSLLACVLLFESDTSCGVSIPLITLAHSDGPLKDYRREISCPGRPGSWSWKTRSEKVQHFVVLFSNSLSQPHFYHDSSTLALRVIDRHSAWACTLLPIDVGEITAALPRGEQLHFSHISHKFIQSNVS